MSLSTVVKAADPLKNPQTCPNFAPTATTQKCSRAVCHASWRRRAPHQRHASARWLSRIRRLCVRRVRAASRSSSLWIRCLSPPATGSTWRSVASTTVCTSTASSRTSWRSLVVPTRAISAAIVALPAPVGPSRTARSRCWGPARASRDRRTAARAQQYARTRRPGGGRAGSRRPPMRPAALAGLQSPRPLGAAPQHSRGAPLFSLSPMPRPKR